MGIIGTTSFFPSKNLGCYGDGGAIFTNDDHLGTVLRQSGQPRPNPPVLPRFGGRKLPVGYDTSRHSARETAAFGRVRRRPQHRGQLLRQCLCRQPQHQNPVRAPYGNHVFHQYTLTLAEGVDRDGLGNFLTEKGVPNKVYYPVPQHLQKAYNLKGYKEGDLPVAEDLSRRVISLPMHTELTEEQLKYITDTVLEFVK